MSQFTDLIAQLGEKTGLPLEVDEHNSCALEYEDLIICLQYREASEDIVIFAPVTDPDKVAVLSEEVLRAALKLAYNGVGTSRNFLGLFQESLILSNYIELNDLTPELLAVKLQAFAQAAVAVRAGILNLLQDVVSEESGSLDGDMLGLSV